MKPYQLLDEAGKPLSKSFQKTLIKMSEKQILLDDYSDSPEKTSKLRNPFSGAEVSCTSLCHDICEWICSSRPIAGMTRQDWDNARYTVLACWPDVYYAIID